MLFADLVILNANITTVNENNPRDKVIALKNGKIVKVEKTNKIKKLVGKNTIIIDS